MVNEVATCGLHLFKRASGPLRPLPIAVLSLGSNILSLQVDAITGCFPTKLTCTLRCASVLPTDTESVWRWVLLMYSIDMRHML
jgi:hypothetical protein